MPPQATTTTGGFRYTPASYLQRTRPENRPWSSSASNSSSLNSSSIFTEDMDDFELGALRQELRPSRKETSIEEHFKNRVQRKKESYRSIIKGQEDVAPLSEVTPETLLEAEESSSRSMTSSQYSKASMGSNSNSTSQSSSKSVNSSEAARQARLQRLSGKPTGTEDSEAARVRNLRAHRLRHSLKKLAEEENMTEMLRQRRRKQAELDRLAQEREKVEAAKRESEAERLAEERRQLAEERRLLEEAKRQALAYELDNRRHAPSHDEDDESEDSQEVKQNNKKKIRKVRSETSETHPATETSREEKEDDDEPSTVWEEIQWFLRDSGIYNNCVSSCFGVEEISRRRRRRSSKSSQKSGKSKPILTETHDLALRVDTF